ncbi:hypothetical protein HAX54_045826 [Datura stramonium]|uniref:F-box associated beta-propeller type 3 domain-containing protein n=1 Tax=Datura stramonium TaxID=4076 RepID=A0ABS8SS26_DATST|nr:hypothetical protein [Datura stramonium]
MENKSDLTKFSIPNDIMYGIFSWLPYKSLTRFKCLSKFYDSLVSDSSFINIHHAHSVSRPGNMKLVALFHPDRMELGAHSEDGNRFCTIYQKSSAEHKKTTVVRIEELDGIKFPRFDYVNGLFCLWNRNVHPPAIYNPTTSKLRYLPCLNRTDYGFSTSYYYSLGFEPDEKKYKILMSSTPEHKNSPARQWVLTLGSSESWREIKSAPCFLFLLLRGGVCIEGAIYFVGAHKKRCIVAFNVRTENFRIISLWNDAIDVPSRNFYNLIEVKGKLAVVDRSRWDEGEMDLRILQSCGTREEWGKQTILFSEEVCDSLKTDFMGCFCSSTPDGEILFIALHQNWMVLYDLKKKSWREIKITELAETVKLVGIYSHIDSLLSCIYC